MFDRLMKRSVLLFALALLGVQGSVPTSVTGTWNRGDPETGGGLLMVKQEGRRALFQLESWRGAPSYSSGFVDGSFVLDGDRGVFRAEGDSGPCELEFVFSDDAVVIDYVDVSTDCGFGHAVYANGTYQRTSSEPPTFCEGDCREAQ